jgi:hypothetical protein
MAIIISSESEALHKSMFVDINKTLDVNDGILNGETPSYDEKI